MLDNIYPAATYNTPHGKSNPRQDRPCTSHNTTVRPRVIETLFTLLYRINATLANVILRRVLWIRVTLWFQSGGGTFEHALACVGVEEVVLGAGAQNRCPVGAVPVLAAVVGVDVLEVVFGTDGGCLACYAAPLRSGAKLYIQLLGTHLQVRIVYQAFWAGIQLR